VIEMSEGVSKNAPIVLAAQQIKRAQDRFESISRKSNAQLSFEREARFALELVQNNERLQQCDPQTIYSSILNVAALGLSLNPVQGEAALIPRWNTKKRMLDCTLSPMYRGLVRLATESGRVSHIKAELVFQDDEIKMKLGSNPEIHHDPLGSIMAGEAARVIDFVDKDRNKLRAVYVVAHLKNGEKIIGVMSYDEVLKVAMCSEAFNPKPDRKTNKRRPPSGPWVEHPGEMAKKSLINREQKTWPRTSSEPDRLDAAVEIMKDADEKEGYVSNQGEAKLLLSDAQIKELKDLADRQNLSYDRVCKTAEVELIEHIPAEMFDDIKQKLEGRLAEYVKQAEARKELEEATSGE
jgi:recombination protein RecT